MLNYVPQFIKIRVVFHTLISEGKTMTPNIFFAFLTHLTHYLTGNFTHERPKANKSE